METRTITPDTTIYIIAGHEPQWISAADSPEKAVAEAIRGIGLSPDLAKPFNVYGLEASKFLPYENALGPLRELMQKATDFGATCDYDHEEAVRLAREEEVEKFEEAPCGNALAELS